MRKSVQWNGWALLYKVAKQKWTNNTKTNCRQLWTQEMHASNDKWRQATRPFQSFQKPGLHDLGSLVIAQQDHIDSYWFILTTFYQGIPNAAYVLRCEFHCGWELTDAASCSIRLRSIAVWRWRPCCGKPRHWLSQKCGWMCRHILQDLQANMPR